MIKKIISFAIIIIIISSCSGEKKSKFLDEVITRDNLLSITEKLKNDKDMTIEELELYSNGLTRFGTSIDSIIGKKVSDIIEKQREYKKEYILNMLNTQTANLQIHLNLDFKYVGVQKADNDTLNTNILHFQLTNKSDKTIDKVEGELEFYDYNNQIVKRFPVSIENSLPAGVAQKFTNAYKHEPDNPRDTIIRSKYVRLQALWKPALLHFADGKKIVVKYSN